MQQRRTPLSRASPRPKHAVWAPLRAQGANKYNASRLSNISQKRKVKTSNNAHGAHARSTQTHIDKRMVFHNDIRPAKVAQTSKS